MNTFQDKDEKVWVSLEDYEELRKIAMESKLIIEGIQKSLGVWTTSEALQKIADLQKENKNV
jgi:hypothetical protein